MALETALFRIAEAARRVGVSASTLRLWERQGLLRPSRGDGRYRLYSGADLERLDRIRQLRRVDGLNAPAIRRLLEGPAEATPGRSEHRGRRAADASSALPGRLRALRQAQGLSLRQAGERTGLSPSFISSLERSLTGASVGALQRLTAAYGTTLGELTRDPGAEGGRLVRPSERRTLEVSGRRVRIERLSSVVTSLQPDLFVLAPGASSENYYAHQGDEFMYLLVGRLGVWLDEREHYELGPGDALTFPSTLSHRFQALGPTETRVLWINTPPTF